MKIQFLALAVCLSAVIPAGAVKPIESLLQEKPEIYGQNDAHSLMTPGASPAEEAVLAPLREKAYSIAALFRAGDVRGDGTLNLRPYRNSIHPNIPLCSGLMFSDEQAGSFCTGFLVAPSILMTAGHCVLSQDDCETITFVFDWNDGSSAQAGKVDPRKSLFACRKLLAREYDRRVFFNDGGKDYALVLLSTDTGRQPLAFSDAGCKVAEGTKLAVIGHPAGLATKLVPGGRVREGGNDITFPTDTDTFVGNSGSPVFNVQTGLLEGMLVRGGDDYVVLAPKDKVAELKKDSYIKRADYDVLPSPDGKTCIAYHTVAQDGGKGEDVLRASFLRAEFAKAIAGLAGNRNAGGDSPTPSAGPDKKIVR